MAKRRTKQQITADKIIKANLEILGEKIYKQTRKKTRVLTGSLKNSINYSVKPDTRLTFFQNIYGKDVRPAGEKTGETDALLITIKKLLPEGIEVIKKDLTESILYPFRK
jgi:mRNA-degrading endonuclease YafQ of YafQ-DinJ toxin-antitoxin module